MAGVYPVTHGKARFMTTPPMDSALPELWMNVTDVFSIRGRGTVVTGRLEGNGLLSLGDIAVCDGVRWQVSGIEQFRSVLTTAEPGSNIGVLLRDAPAGNALRGRTLQFEPSGRTAGAPGPQFTVLAPKKKLWRR
jgi:elongation factor Tu